MGLVYKTGWRMRIIQINDVGNLFKRAVNHARLRMSNTNRTKKRARSDVAFEKKVRTVGGKGVKKRSYYC